MVNEYKKNSQNSISQNVIRIKSMQIKTNEINSINRINFYFFKKKYKNHFLNHIISKLKKIQLFYALHNCYKNFVK